MTWSSFGSFLLIVTVLTLVPGADFAVTVKNTLVGGRSQGWWAAAGIGASSAVQGTVAALALSHAVIGCLYLFVLVTALHRMRGMLARRRVRRSLDVATGVVLLGFSASLALEA